MSKSIMKDMSVQRTISLPLSLFNKVSDEGAVMGKGFSDATQVLLRIGISVREANRAMEEKEIKASLKKQQEGSQ